MAVNVKITIEGEESLADAFGLFGARVRDLRPYWPQVAGRFYQHERETFDSSGFGTWKPLSDRYRIWKARHFPSTSILEATGNLRRSLTSQSTPNSIYREAPLSLELGTTVRYAKAHHEGATLKIRRGARAAGKGKKARQANASRPTNPAILPRRPLIIITPELEAGIGEIIQLGLGRYGAELGFTVR